MKDQKVTIIGGGLIGPGWAALFLAHGAEVAVYDPDVEARAQIGPAVRGALEDLGYGHRIVRLDVAGDLASACEGADFIQECGPDRLQVKQEIIAGIEGHVAPDIVIATSTSSLLASDIQQGARHPGRILTGHPFNPPHLMPLVELVAGTRTSDAAMNRAREVYQALGRVVIEPAQEATGHIANRLGAALFREAVHMVASGICTPADIDTAIANGPGLRWALMGPFATYHLGGGAGGFDHYMDHLGPTQAARWAELGTPELDPETVDRLKQGVAAMLREESDAELRARRDTGLKALLKMKQGLCE